MHNRPLSISLWCHAPDSCAPGCVSPNHPKHTAAPSTLPNTRPRALPRYGVGVGLDDRRLAKRVQNILRAPTRVYTLLCASKSVFHTPGSRGVHSRPWGPPYTIPRYARLRSVGAPAQVERRKGPRRKAGQFRMLCNCYSWSFCSIVVIRTQSAASVR